MREITSNLKAYFHEQPVLCRVKTSVNDGWLEGACRVSIKEWKKIPVETCANLVRIFRKRLLEVVKVKGHATDCQYRYFDAVSSVYG